MKKNLLVSGLIALSMLLISCENNDENVDNSSSITGEWKRIKEVDVCSSGVIYDSYNFTSCEQSGSLSLNSNGTFFLVEFEEENGNCIETFVQNGNWVLNENMLIMTNDNETLSYEVFSLENNIMQIGNTYDENEGDFCEDGSRTSKYYTEYQR